MSETPLLGLPVLEANQAQKHVTHNEALLLLDAAIHLSVISRSIASPPGAPEDGDRYLVGPSATGLWAGQDGRLAIRQAAGWTFAQPRKGWRVWIEDEGKLFVFDGILWRDLQAIDELSNMELLGVNTTADLSNRLAVSSPSVLFNHAGGDHRLKINKEAAADTASLLYQSGFSGRAEMGLAGDDDFHVKVSADGTSWHEAIVVDRSSGEVSMPNTSLTLPNGDKGDVTISGGTWHFERTDGTPGNGTADDAPYIRDMLAAGKTVVLSDRKLYRLQSRVDFTVDGTGITAPMGAKVVMSTAAGHFDNAVYGSRYNTNAVGLYGVGRKGLFIQGLAITTSAWVDNTYLKALAFDECDDLRLADLEISNFSRGRGLITLNDCDRALILRPYLHHCWSNSVVGSKQELQITGISVDDDASVGSKRGKIRDPRIEYLTVGDSVREILGYQTDGINFLGHSTLKPTLDWLIEGGHFFNVGEGIDCFGSGTIVHGSHFRRCFGAGVKFAYGASGNEVSDCVFHEMGLHAIYMGGGNSPTILDDLDANRISDIKVLGVNTGGDWENADGGKSYDAALYGGALPWTTSNNGAIRIDLPTPVINAVTNLEIRNLTADGLGTGRFGIFVQGSAGGSPIRASGINIRNFIEARIQDSAGYVLELDDSLAKAKGDFIQDSTTLNSLLLSRHDMVSAAWNGSFELGDVNWTREASGGLGWKIQNDAPNARSGNWVAMNDNVAGSNLLLRCQNRQRVRPGETIYAEAWIKSSAGAAFTTCRVSLSFWDKDGVVVSASSAGNNFNTAQLTYVRTSTNIVAPANAVYFSVNVQVVKTAGTIWVDDISAYRQRDASQILSAATITSTLLGGDVSAAGKTLLTAADATAQRSVLGISDGDKGDISISGSGAVWTVDAGAIDTTKLGGDVTAAGKELLNDADAVAQRATLGISLSLFNQSIAAQGAGFATDTYLAGSSIAVPDNALRSGSRYRLIFDVSKTAAGTAAPVVTLRFGTNGTTADPSLATLTFQAQTAVADDGLFEINVTFRSVGSGTSAVIQAVGNLRHRLSTTGLANLPGPTVRATSAGFNSTLSNAVLGVSVSGGASAAWTVSLAQATLDNLN